MAIEERTPELVSATIDIEEAADRLDTCKYTLKRWHAAGMYPRAVVVEGGELRYYPDAIAETLRTLQHPDPGN